MKNKRINVKAKIYPIIWSGIIVMSIYLLIHFAVLYFSDDLGQANLSLKDSIFSDLSCYILEEGSSLVNYTADGEEHYSLPIILVDNQLAIQKFTYEDAVLTANAQEGSLFPVISNSNNDLEESIPAMNTDDVQTMLGYYEISEECLSTEYILSNGAMCNDNMEGYVLDGQNTDELQVGFAEGDIYYEDMEDVATSEDSSSEETINSDGVVDYTLEQLRDVKFLVKNFYIVDSSTKVTKNLFDGEQLLEMDMTIKQDNEERQILIYHTHSQEGYIDSRPDNAEDTVVGVGTCLAEILTEEYGYNVIHDTSTYDMEDGILSRNKAYSRAEDGLKKILKENPSIEVVIDLHRDSGDERVTIIDGKETAKIMLFNGLSRDQNGPITYLENPNLQDNLAFSLQMQIKSHELYPGLFLKNYLKLYRYNMHVRPKSLLVELGTANNTLQSAKNAMEPFAQILNDILQQ